MGSTNSHQAEMMIYSSGVYGNQMIKVMKSIMNTKSIPLLYIGNEHTDIEGKKNHTVYNHF